MLLRRVVNGFLLWSALVCVGAAAWASEYHGQVTFGGLPVPGSTVTVTATQGDKKVVAISDDQGVFSFADLADGTWTLTIQMTGFAPLKQDIAIAANGPAGTFELKLMSLDQIRAENKPVKVDATQIAAVAVPSAPSAATAAATAPGKAGAPAAKAAAGAAGAGAKGGAQVAAGPAPAVDPAQDANAAQANDGLLINGSVNNAATSQYSMNQAFGNSRNGGRSLYNGNLFLRLDNSTLDAAPYPVTGVAAPRPQFNNFTLGVNWGGPLKIPHLMPRGPYFQVNYNRTQNSSFIAQSAIVPSLADGSGNYTLASAIFAPVDLATVAPACNTYLLGNGFTQTQINNGTAQFANNIIPAACVSHQAATLLTLYPAPNISGSPLGQNYQIPLNTSTHSDQVGLNMNKQLGNKNNVSGNFQYGGSRTSNPNIFGFLDKQNQLSMGFNVNWNHRFSQRLSGTLSYSFTRQRSQLMPFFATNQNNIEKTAGINLPSTVPAPSSAFWGPPSLGFSSGIAGLNDGISSYNRNETNGISTNFYWNRFRHNLKFGGDFKRLEFNYLTQSNPYGSFSFTGTSTDGSSSRSDFADFLLGVPTTSNFAYGNADKYLRQSQYDLYITDDFRVNPEFSVQAGVRWEYGAPITELKGRLVNLDITQGFAAETQVLGSSPKGTLTSQSYPTSLVHPDYSRPEPNVGIAWRPISGSSLLIRSGFQVSNDTSVYQSSAYAMAQQTPGLGAPWISQSLSIANSAICPFNLQNPFSSSCSKTSPDTFAIDPHFKVGYVQAWNLSVQRDLPYSMQAIVTYNGIKGVHGVQEILPNTCPPGATCGTAVSGYRYRTSGGNLTRESGTLEVRRRLRNGFTARLLYTYAKSLDDDYSLSGQGSTNNTGGLAQDWLHPEAQRALSVTDQRQLLNFTGQYTTGMGLGGKALLSGWKGAIYKEWTVSTEITAGTGLPETVICSSCIATGTGTTGSVRPNLLGSPYAGAPAGFRLNAAAFAAPLGTWGNARRNIIQGPDQFSMNAHMQRTFRLHDRYTLDATLNASNILNHVVYTGWNTNWSNPVLANGTVSSIANKSFGAPSSAGSMRSLSLQFRMRF